MTVTPAHRGKSFVTALVRRALVPVDIAPLVWFRVAFGVIMLVEVGRFFQNGWIASYATGAAFHFKYYGFEWVRPWTGPGMEIHFAVLGGVAVCVALGIAYRLMTVLFFLGFTYVFLLEQARYLNHFYLVCLYSLLLACVSAHRALSLDAWLRPELRSGTTPAWTLWLLRAQICIVYFFGGVAKLNGDWLCGEPMRIWLAQRTEFPVLGRYFTEDWMVWFFSYGGLAFDLCITPLLLWRRTRWLAFTLALLFNAMNSCLFEIGIFPWFALGATVLLFADGLPRPLAWLWREVPAMESGKNFAPTKPVLRQYFALSLAAAYFLLQILVPLRHWLYPGNVHWTELGHRFSWRMKLRTKAAELKLTARDPQTRRKWEVKPLDYINARQYQQASARPDMILQLCHHVAADLQAKMGRRVEVHAVVLASLNGRLPQPLINPQVDLAAQPRTLGNVSWIMPLSIPLPAPGAPRFSGFANDGSEDEPNIPSTLPGLLSTIGLLTLVGCFMASITGGGIYLWRRARPMLSISPDAHFQQK